jgi:hydroxymethylpyrimidine kinase/phosphomethylpyrimidine kinase/thiamine-phosphate diphosphorylase
VAHSPAPVVAIGGLLKPADMERFAACNPAALCVVRGLGTMESDMRVAIPALREAISLGRARIHGAPHRLMLPQPVL